MGDETDKGGGSSAWYNVPTWDGSPMTYRAFRREMRWWVSSLDLQATSKYNLAARWLLKQSGIVRQRGEEFSPEELAYKPAVTFKDPDTGEEFEDSPADYLYGLNKLLGALEGINGQTVLDKRGELRGQFYTELKRKPLERMSEYCTRFRTLVADLQSEGVVLPKSELGWFLKDKMGLDPLRKQLLETSLQGREDYDVIEAESLRLFKDLHLADPLYKRLDRGDRPKLTIRKLFQSTAPSSAASSASSGFGRSSRFSGSSIASSRTSTSGASNSSQPRRVYLTEVPEVEEESCEQEDEVLATEHEDELAGDGSLEEILQTQAECFATELQEAEQLGLDGETLQGLEAGFEQTAEALVTMREARTKLAALRKDRGYGKASSSAKPGAGQASARKQSGKHPCFDCGEHGHWSGDKECPKPGQGLARPKAGPQSKMKPRQVRVAEALSVASVNDTISSTSPSAVVSFDPVTTTTLIPSSSHEASMVMHVGSVPIQTALIASLASTSHSTLISSSAQEIAEDKLDVGALDSACNRTCAGPVWMQAFLDKLRHAPQWIQNLVTSVDEAENFRFGNGGTVPSSRRWRLPASIGDRLVLIWVSLVPVNSLGCLLGRDFLDAVGGVLNFADRTLQCSFLGTPQLKLQQMSAGHFMLPLQPDVWPRPVTCRWRRVGLDGIIELQMSPSSWLQRRLDEGIQGHPGTRHDHMLTESSLAACNLTASPVGFGTHEIDIVELAQSDMPAPASTVTQRQHPERPGRPQAVCKDPQHVPASDLGHSQVAPVCAPAVGSPTLAPWRFAFVAMRAFIIALLALSLSIHCYGSTMAVASPGNGVATHPDLAASRGSELSRCLHCPEPDRDVTIPRQSWLESSFLGRFTAVWIFGSESNARSEISAQERSDGRSPATSSERHCCWDSRRCCSPIDWPQGRFADTSGRLDPPCLTAGGGVGPERHRGNDPEEGSTYGGSAQSHQCGTQKPPIQQCDIGNCGSSGSCSPGNPSITFHEVMAVSRTHIGGGRAENPRSDWSTRTAIPDHADASAAAHHPPAEPRLFSSSRDTTTNTANVRLSDSEAEDYKIKDKVKPGVGQMISQAWNRHRRDQLLISANAQQIREALMASWTSEMHGYMNEALAIELQFPSPFVQEIYSDTEPIARAAQRRGLVAGETLTLGRGFDFRLASHRAAALQLIRRKRPYVIVLAFPCGPWSPLQYLNPAMDLDQRRAEGRELIAFAVQVAEEQMKFNRHLVIENPLPSLGWKVEELDELRQSPEVLEVVVDMCQFNLRGPDGGLHRKATRLLTSMQAVVSILMNCRCPGGHQHSPVLGGSKITAAAGHYTKEFSDALVQGFMDQFDFETMVQSRNDGHAPQHETNVSEHEILAEEDAEEDGRLADEESDDSLQPTSEEKSMTISPAVRNAVFRLHVNTGHRHPLRLARALIVCGAPAETVAAAKMLKCSVCRERRQPKSRAPASLPPPREVGQQIHIDLVVLEDALKRSYFVAHATDNVSRFQAAQVLPNKSSAAVIAFLQQRWLPLLGRPHTIVADQGKEFVSVEFSDWCDAQSIYLFHIGVGAPWQNGIAERSGGTLKALAGSIIQAQAVIQPSEMDSVVSEAVLAYNCDVNELGVAPIQAVTGKVPQVQGDVLNDFGRRLAEHSLIESSPSLQRQVAMRETARLAMVRLHYSRGLRQAELARSRSTTAPSVPEPGDLVFFWRAQKYNSKKDVPAGATRRRLSLKRWHGPGLMLAREGPQDGHSSNIFVSYRGQVTKCPVEHVRKASSLENIAAGAWEAAIDEVINAAKHDPTQAPAAVAVPDSSDEELILVPGAQAPSVAAQAPIGFSDGPGLMADGPGLTAEGPGLVPGVGLMPSELAAAMHAGSHSAGPSSAGVASRRDSLLTAQSDGTVGPAPGTPVPDLILQASQLASRPGFQSTLSRAREVDQQSDRGIKRSADQELPRPTVPGDLSDAGSGPADAQALERQPAFEALTMTWEQLCNVSESTTVHPLLQLQALAEMDRREPLEVRENDHGTWDGRWAICVNMTGRFSHSWACRFLQENMMSSMPSQPTRRSNGPSCLLRRKLSGVMQLLLVGLPTWTTRPSKF